MDAPADPITALARAFVRVPAVKAAMAPIEQMIRFGDGEGSKRSILLVGPSFVGKSALIDHLLLADPPRREDRRLVRPICVARVHGSSYGGLLSVLLEALGDPSPETGTNSARLARVIKQLREQGVRLLVVDELQELVDSDTDKVAYGAANIIKAILNDGPCPLLLAGVTHATRITGTNAQLESRNRIVEMGPYDWRVVAQQQETQVFLDQIERRIGLPQPSHLGRLDVAWRFAHFSGGLRGRMVSLLREVLERRAMDGAAAPCITMEMLARAADPLLLRERHPRPNAFRLTEEIEFDPAPMYEATKEPPARSRRPSKRGQDELFA